MDSRASVEITPQSCIVRIGDGDPQMLHSWTCRLVAASSAILFLGGPACAAGYFIDQSQSIPGLGRADAGNVAAASDPSTVFSNPAGITELWRGADPDDIRRASSGAVLVIPTNKLKNKRMIGYPKGYGESEATVPQIIPRITPFGVELDVVGTDVPIDGPNQSNPGDPTPVGNAYMVQRLPNTPWSFGLGLTAPFGLGGEFDDNWFGRYDATEVRLVTVNFSPVVAYKLSDRISIGGGLDVQYADAKLISAVPNPDPLTGTISANTDGRFRVEGDDWSVGYNVGILYKVTPTLRAGVHYRSGIDHTLDGKATLKGLTGFLSTANFTSGASSELNLPDILSAGAVFDISYRWALFGDFTWYNWSVAEETRIKFDNGALPDAVRPAHFRDTYTVALGVERYQNENWTFRTGIKFDRTPTNDRFRDTTFADDDRVWFAVGASYKISDSLTADFAFSHLFVKDTSVDIERSFFDGTPFATTTRTKADIESYVDNIGLNVRYSF